MLLQNRDINKYRIFSTIDCKYQDKSSTFTHQFFLGKQKSLKLTGIIREKI
jgi:hypothetical protein